MIDHLTRLSRGFCRAATILFPLAFPSEHLAHANGTETPVTEIRRIEGPLFARKE
jgi:hypothetical protein